MKRILLVLTVVLMMAALMVVMAAPAFAKNPHSATGGGKQYNYAFAGTGDNGWHGGSHHGLHGEGNYGVGSDP